MRSIFSVPKETHRFFIEELSGSTHPKVLMASRLVGFHKMMKTSERPIINLMATITENDCRTVHGLNLKRISKECNTAMIDLAPIVVKQNMKYKCVPKTEEWKIPVLNELLEIKIFSDKSLPAKEQDELNEMIKIIST